MIESNLRKRVSAVVVHNGRLLGFNAEDPTSGDRYIFIPGGMREPGESIEDTAVRETLEETGYAIVVGSTHRIFRKYLFSWNGKIHDCETWYLLATLKSDEPVAVNDAHYHRGVTWIPLKDIDTVFGYHSDILYPIKELTACV